MCDRSQGTLSEETSGCMLDRLSSSNTGRHAADANSHCVDTCNATSEYSSTTSYGKLSSVASQNLSIIVEAINHLEGDKHVNSATSDKVRFFYLYNPVSTLTSILCILDTYL